MEYLEIRDMPLSLPLVKAQAQAFLHRFDLKLEPLDYYAGVFAGDELLCCGGFCGNVIKCIAADEQARGMGLLNKLMTHLRSILSDKDNLFVFTKSRNAEIFQSLSFNLVGSGGGAILLESRRGGIEKQVEKWRLALPPCEKSAIVMNCNPFTLGHRHLAEVAAASSPHLVIFVVEAEKSLFPFNVRLDLAQKGCRHLENVTVVPGGDYIISQATFPSYFIKELTDVASAHAALDIDIFSRRIAPGLNITARFAGEEPKDPLTAHYNKAMEEGLPPAGIKLNIIPRKEEEGTAISASSVRRLLEAGNLGAIEKLVPPTTYEYILRKGRSLINE